MRLFDGASLLQLAARRLEPIFDPQHIWVITSEHHLDQVASELPQIPRERLIGEPIGRDTANAIGLAAAIIAQEDLEATMAVFTADHLISPVDAFTESIRIGLNTVQQHPEALVTWGHHTDRSAYRLRLHPPRRECLLPCLPRRSLQGKTHP
jgi:mannose-1-phosphate guanylyltransferase